VFLVVVLFIALPIAELYVIIKVGEAIGALPTIALLVLDSIIGAALLRHQGRAAWNRFNIALAENRVPAKETFDGAMVILGAALLLTPGFITDIFGFLLLIPPTRAFVRGASSWAVLRRFGFGTRIFIWGAANAPRPGRSSRSGPAAGRDYDVEGTAQEVPDRTDQIGPPPSPHAER
jgi:UPF0716 protein FxsA